MRIELFFRDSGDDHVSRGCPRAGWTRVVISRGSETDHYRCPLCFPLFGRSQEHTFGSYVSSETLREKEENGPLEPELELFVSLQLLAVCGASTG